MRTFPSRRLDMVLSHAVLVFLLFAQLAVTSSHWFPPISTTEEQQPQLFRIVNFPNFQESFLSQFSGQLYSSPDNVSGLNSSRFQWTSVTMFSESKSQTSWLIVAGTSPKSKGIGTAFTTDFSAVFACQVVPRPDKPGGFDLSTCEILGLDIGSPTSNYSDAGILGKGLQSLQLPSGGGVVVFCDPLWHSNQGTQSPGGRCSVLERTRGAWSSSEPVEFCSSGGRTMPCAGGFSIDLRLTEDGTNAQLLAGLPFAQPNRRVRTVDNLLRRGQQHLRDIESDEEEFGSSVAWSPHLASRSDALAIVGSPSTSVQGFRVSNLIEDIDTVVLRMAGSAFGGIGFAVETSVANNSMVVLAGAPFESVERVGANTGRVYVQFWESGGVHNFSLEGTRSGEMFGYALSRIGDVDGDGIGEVAISAPAIEAESIPGRVYIYRVLPGYRLDTYPLQVSDVVYRGFIC